MITSLINLLKMHRNILNRDEKKYFCYLSLLFLLISVFDIIGISAIGYFLYVMMNPDSIREFVLINQILPTNLSPQHTLTLLGGTMIVVFALKTVLGFNFQKKLITYCFSVGTRLRVKLLEQFLYAPFSYLTKHHSSEIVAQILNYSNGYSALSLVPFMTALVHIYSVCAIIIFLFCMYPLVTIVLIFLLIMLLKLNLFLIKNKVYEAGQQINQTNEQMYKIVHEGLLGIKEVRVLGKENLFLNRLKIISQCNAKANGFINVAQKLPFYFLESGLFFAIISFCLLALNFGMEVQVIVVLCGTLVTTGARLLPSLYQIITSVVTVKGNQHSLETTYNNLINFNSLFKEELLWSSHQVSHVGRKAFTNIEFKNLFYRYQNSEEYAIRNVSLGFKRGESIGIIGPSGAGKSTLVDIMLGLLTPEAGEILIDGTPLVDRKAWVNRFAYIPQHIFLLDASIKENIVFGNESQLNEGRLKKALQLAQLESVIERLPQGLDTMIGENGVRLSGGQRQRVVLARAFYHEREIIIMDEATAALDHETEYEVVQAIKELHQIKTIVIIAHRYTTVKYCDVIYRLTEGRLIQSGSFEKVIGNY